MDKTSDDLIPLATSRMAPNPFRTPPRRSRRLTIGVLALVALVATACGSSSKTASTASSPSASSPSASSGAASGGINDPYANDTGASTTSTTATATGTTVSVTSVPAAGGQVLVGPNGRTLYLFEKDSGTTSACSGACAAAWPPLTAAGTATAGSGVTASKLSVSNGQVVYNGHLLYYYAADAAAGDAKGIGIPSWFPVNADGNKVGGG